MATETTVLQPTPSSEKSAYFDAPILHIHTSQAEPFHDAPAGSTAGAVTPSQSRTSSIKGANVLRKKSAAPTVAAGGRTPSRSRRQSLVKEDTSAPVKDINPAEIDDDNITDLEEGGIENSVLSRDYSKIAKKDTSPVSASRRSAHTASRAASTRSKVRSRAEPEPVVSDDSSLIDSATDDDDNDGHPTRANARQLEDAQSHHARRSSAPPRSRRLAAASEGSSPSLRRSVDQGSRRAYPASTRSGTVKRSGTLSGGTFGGGAGTIGPNADPEPEEREQFRQRAVSAAASLNQKQAKKIGKEELKEGKRLSKILKHEGKVERKALEVAMKELAELQALQQRAVKEESRAHAYNTKSLKAAHKDELAFLEAQRRHELAQTELRTKRDALDASREHAQRTTEMLQEKNREVEMLRAQKAADGREREVKMSSLLGKTKV